MSDSSISAMETHLVVKVLLSVGGGITVSSKIVGLPKVGAVRAAIVYLKSMLISASPISMRTK
jgi:hypothetical protein